MIISSAWYGETGRSASLSFLCNVNTEEAFFEVRCSGDKDALERFDTFTEAVRRYKELDKWAKGE